MAEVGYTKGRKKWLGVNATRRGKDTSAIEIETLNELIIESHRLTKQPLCIHQDDAMGYYDRIIRTHTTIDCRKFGISDNVCTLHLKVHDNMKFQKQINNKNLKDNIQKYEETYNE